MLYSYQKVHADYSQVGESKKTATPAAKNPEDAEMSSYESFSRRESTTY